MNLSVQDFNEKYSSFDFTCGNSNIDYMFRNHIPVLHRESKAVTKLFFSNDVLVGFCTLLADRISKSNTKVFLGGSHPTYYPAMQIYAIGVHKNYQRKGIGSQIMEWIISTAFSIRQNVGLTFIVIESYNEEKLLNFYENIGFVNWKYLEIDNERDLIPMVYDFRGLDGVI